VAKGSIIKITLAAFNESTLKTIAVIVTACTTSICGCRGKERRHEDDKGGDFVKSHIGVDVAFGLFVLSSLVYEKLRVLGGYRSPMYCASCFWSRYK
jgi:hypothetical protein